MGHERMEVQARKFYSQRNMYTVYSVVLILGAVSLIEYDRA